MIRIYEAIIESDETGYSVEFPDIPGCITQGIDLEDAYVMAYDALGLMLEDIAESGEKLPEPIYGHSAESGQRIVAFAVNMDQIFTEKYVTVNEAADMLDVTSQRIQALIKSGDIISTKIGTSRMINQKSVIDYRARRVPSGRPRKLQSLA